MDHTVRCALAGDRHAAGNALGVDRLIALGAGADAIADVLAFPIEWR